MKICVEAKNRKHFKKVMGKYSEEGYDFWNTFGEVSCIDVDGKYCKRELYEEKNYKILTYKQWEAILKGGIEKVAIRSNHVDRFLELSRVYWVNNFSEETWNAHFDEKLCVDVSGEFCCKEWYKNRGYLILSYKEWKAIRGEKND